MINIIKCGTKTEADAIAHGAELIEVIQHGSELEAQLIKEGAKLIKKGTWALYSERYVTVHTYEEVR